MATHMNIEDHTLPCAVCGHPKDSHRERSGCDHSQNPLSPSASIFCKCPAYREAGTRT